MSYFEAKLWELLPDIYRLNDPHGDLAALLKNVGITLDELKELIDQLPAKFDLDKTPASYVPLLGELVGHRFAATQDVEAQRRDIREAVEFYRRKGTVPAIHRALDQIGWQGRIRETFRDAARLNRRASINQSRLPGRIYSLGVYRVESDNQVQGLRDALAPHHPAGTATYYLQWLSTLLSAEHHFEAFLKRFIQGVAFVDLDETFIVNRNPLNSDRHLTRQKTIWELVQVTNSTTLHQGIETGAVCRNHWHARGTRFRTNLSVLNQGRKLPNLWLSERRSASCCPVVTEETRLTNDKPSMRLAGQALNQARLNWIPARCEVRFQQKDLLSTANHPERSSQDESKSLSLVSQALPSRSFRTGHHALSGNTKLQGETSRQSVLMSVLAEATWAEIQSAGDLVHRWQKRRPGFGLNGRTLNQAPLTNGTLTEDRATFSIRVDTGAPRKRLVQPVALNRGRLNRSGLRLSRQRTLPLRLGSMALNQAGFQMTEPAIEWQFRQRDVTTQDTATIDSATNTFTATIWPEPRSDT
ncbi:Phage tail protein (Tail_P2_I) [Sulfidibacter corallicola]|uniref:Uncharacterized protein n=1 Tax=Sulfidibacter corallicola TaxID=2818388 RepID=A0A8A4TZ39_SULCO|nr:phage tail protein [Sulfidibacter corallicola]QTD54212.1 hypothetical protein J3U87_17340 [Sulfidibacter corallicola]